MNASELLLAARDLFLFGEKEWGRGKLTVDADGNSLKDPKKGERVPYEEAVSVCALGALGCVAGAPATYAVFEPRFAESYPGFSELREAVEFLAQAFGGTNGADSVVACSDAFHRESGGNVSAIVDKFDEAARLAKEEGNAAAQENG